ncbi:dephospho-CoA kinase [Bacillus sp. FJAT-42376]|uniref:dephospho-CoA kinase n=1 Tax=Bacillus sp. FJAT-42376 TaxID=2014076 RepID=UPI000F50B4EE|nr:dephospho-CoA kinase [Bacillus sp. FJAT-42376]AZB43893.1 dephospho-CoA kinase [Bacillus sp. FJAT-42376]
MTLVIGLTGGIASGKSTVSSILKEYGFPIIDADILAKEAVDPGMPAYTQIVEAFGDSILQNDGSIDRAKLGSLIFGDSEKRKVLNGIVHPQVRQEMVRQRDEYIQQGKKAVILDIPLLFESKLTHFADKILLVYVTPDVQVNRLMKRNQYNEKEARQRIDSQMPLEEKKHLADEVLYNNGTVEETKNQLSAIMDKWKLSD